MNLIIDLEIIKAIHSKKTGTIKVNILVSALPSRLPPRYIKANNSINRIEKLIFFQLAIAGILQNNINNTIVPLKGILNRVPTFCIL